MKTALVILILVALILTGAAMLGVVGFHYPRIIRDEPLRHPLRVDRIEGTNVVLDSGAVIALQGIEGPSISNKLQQSEFQIDVEGSQAGPLAIWARQDGWVCGSPWAQPIRIPLIGDTTYKNRRQMIAVGSYIRFSGQSGRREDCPPGSHTT